MRLITERGELTIPEDFSFEVEVNNPFFSDDGTASVPAALPATRHTLEILSRPDRPASAMKHARTMRAILQHGIFQRKCNMVIDSFDSDNGVAVSLAFTESEMYTALKQKKLKDIFSGKELLFENMTIQQVAASLYMECYTKKSIVSTWKDFSIFPVAVEKESEGNGCKIVNEPGKDTFICDARQIDYEDTSIKVPVGYGVSPFLKLHRMLALSFELCGYKVVRNDFASAPFDAIVLLNNCSDSLCREPKIRYKDLVPSITIEELITWLKDRFGATVSVRHSEVSITLIQNAISAAPDSVLTPHKREGISISYPASSRVVLKCSTDIETAEPVAETLSELREKRAVLRSTGIEGDPQANGMILRAPLGKYYTITGYSGPDSYRQKLAGSNCFTYDRNNSEDSTEYSAADRFTPEVDVDRMLMPYIGDRLHYNTSISGEKEETEQLILICFAFWDSSRQSWFGSPYPYLRSGAKITYKTEDLTDKHYPSLTPDGLYGCCWKAYNELLLNSAPEIEAQIDYPLSSILSMDLMTPKLLDGQKVLIKSFSFTISASGILCGKSVLQMLPECSDAIVDEPIEFLEGYFAWKCMDTYDDTIKELYNQFSEDYERISHDNLADYTNSDRPGYEPLRAGETAMHRSRYQWIRIYDVHTEDTMPGKEKVLHTWEEYFVSVREDS